MLRTGRLLHPASPPASRPTTGVSLPGTLASPRTGLTPAGCRELLVRLRQTNLLTVMAPELLDTRGSRGSEVTCIWGSDRSETEIVPRGTLLRSRSAQAPPTYRYPALPSARPRSRSEGHRETQPPPRASSSLPPSCTDLKCTESSKAEPRKIARQRLAHTYLLDQRRTCLPPMADPPAGHVPWHIARSERIGGIWSVGHVDQLVLGDLVPLGWLFSVGAPAACRRHPPIVASG